MKTSRLLVYAAAGMIAGLLIENRALLTRQHLKDQARKLKDKVNKKIEEFPTPAT